MISMRLGVNDETNRHRGEVADCGPDVARLVRVLPGIDHDNTFLSEDDPAVRFEAPSGVNVNAVGELFDLRTEILGTSGPGDYTRGENCQRTSRPGFHGFVSFENGDLSISKPQLMPLALCDAMLRSVARAHHNCCGRTSLGKSHRTVRLPFLNT
jgi:hypothetical protein